MYAGFLKRVFDFVAALICFIILSPIFVVVTLLLLIANNGVPFFIQRRPGMNEKIFSIVKFKTMNDYRNEQGELLPDQERMTAVGNFIRKTSLDEIPQLLNVIKGDMSLVGPRPLLVEYLEIYDAAQKRRHNLRPGITGWAQVNGRNAISWKQKFEYDVWYVDHISFLLDLKILWKTMMKVIKSDGISQAGHVTMHKFTREEI